MSTTGEFCSSWQFLTTILTASCISFSYVISLYINPASSKFLRHPQRSRDDPVEIKERFIKVFIVSIICFVICGLFLAFHPAECRLEKNTVDWICILSKMGLAGVHVWNDVVFPLFVTAVLFAGPIVGDYFMGRWSSYNRAFFNLLYNNLHYRRRIFRDTIYSPHWWRAYFVAPLSEEFVYRACLIPVIRHCYGIKPSILISPLAFGVAHLHHIFDRISQGASVQSAILVTLFQICYTSVFGAYSAFLFLKTGSVIGPILVHSFCNYLGVPEFTGFSQLKPWKLLTVVVVYFTGLLSWIYILWPFIE